MKATLLFALLIAGQGFATEIAATNTNRSAFELVRQLNDAFVQVAETVSPSVVVITVTIKSSVFTEPSESDGPEQRKHYERYHREYDDEPHKGKGSGVIIRKNGFILTNRHVIEDAETIQVRLLDGRTFQAKVHGVDAASDVAVLKIDADDLPVAKLGDSSRVRVGEFAIAIGAPFSLDYTVTFGHISAKSRGNVIPMFMGGQTMDQDFIQTDASINTGNSGGPLVNIDGEVIGINTLIRGMNSGIGFAIPINLARQIGDALIETGRFVRPTLGIEIRALTDEPELQQKISEPKTGIVVRGIVPGSPAARSDLRTNDIIVAVDGVAVNTPQQLRNEVRSKTIGRPLKLDLFRDGKRLSVEAIPEEPAQAAFINDSPSNHNTNQPSTR
jgi:Trypsin-like serine proteases, typically periplasmic, contain C-terminal PDZ domain